MDQLSITRRTTPLLPYPVFKKRGGSCSSSCLPVVLAHVYVLVTRPGASEVTATYDEKHLVSETWPDARGAVDTSVGRWTAPC